MKQVLITGATSGLGLEFTHYYANRGYHVHLLGRNNDKLNELLGQYGHKTKVNLYHVDLGRDDQLNYWLGEVKEIPFDIVINNAGFGDFGDFVESDIHKQEYMIKTNCIALTKIAYMALKGMKQRNAGYLLNVGSVAGFLAGPKMSVYYATKNFVVTFTEALHQEFKGTNVHISCLCPGPTATAFNKNANTKPESLLEMNNSGFKLIKAGEAKKVVLNGIRGLNQNKRLVIPYLSNKLVLMLVKFAPRRWSSEVQAHLMRYRHGKGEKA